SAAAETTPFSARWHPLLSSPRFVPPIRNLQASRSLALDDDLAVPRAQFDLPNLSASVFFAFRDVAAAMNAKSFRRMIEIGLQHSEWFCFPLRRGSSVATDWNNICGAR